MRKSASMFAIALLSSPAAIAQEDGFGGNPDAAIAQDDAALANAPETYQVQPGDTLWGLSQRFLNNPWYWPRIWSYNPQLDNPNWIRPGSVIRFYPGPVAAPVQVLDSEPVESTSESEDVDVGEFDDIPIFEVTRDLDSALRRLPRANTQQLRREYLVSDEMLAAAGELAHAPEEKELLSSFDRAYLKMPENPVVGERLQLFRPGREIKHPITKRVVGRVVELVGTLRVDAVSEHEHLATILESWRDIRRGDRVGRIEGVAISQVEERRNEAEVKGYVVESVQDLVAHLGENHLVFLDRGRKDGVEPGNTFTVVRAGDPFTGELRKMADEDIGRVMVIDVSEQAATGLVVFSNREIIAGDRIEMRVYQ